MAKTREIDEAVGRVRTTSADLPGIYGRLVSLEMNLRGVQATVQRLKEDLEDLMHEAGIKRA